jgi:beta-xylosidase
MWAPAIIEKQNKYYLFFSANDIQNDNEAGGIGVAVADNPGGPYKDHLGKPLIDKFYNGAQPIDQFVFKDADGKYYFMWSEGGWTGPDYSVAYAVADSPFGPFKRIGKILQQDPAIATGAGHHSVIKVPGKDEWYIVYHRRPLTETDRNARETCIDRMYFDEQGLIRPVVITKESVKKHPLK